LQESLPQGGTGSEIRPFDERALRALLINAFVRFKLVPLNIVHESQQIIATTYFMPLMLMNNNDANKILSLLDSLCEARIMTSSSMQLDLIKTVVELIGNDHVDVKEAIPSDVQDFPSLKYLTASFLKQHIYLFRQANSIPVDIKTHIDMRYKPASDSRITFDFHCSFPDRPWESESHAAAFIIKTLCAIPHDLDEVREERLSCILLLARLTTRYDFVKRLEHHGASLDKLPNTLKSRYQEYLILTTKLRTDQFDEFDCRALLITAFVHFELVPENVTCFDSTHHASLYTPPLLLMSDNIERVPSLLDMLSDTRRMRREGRQVQLMTNIANLIGVDKVNLYEVIPMELISQQSTTGKMGFFDRNDKKSSLTNDGSLVLTRQYNCHYLAQSFDYENSLEDKSWTSESHAASCVIQEICRYPNLQERLPCLLLLAILTTRYDLAQRLEAQGITLGQLPDRIQSRYSEYLELAKVVDPILTL
jgi:hypothetical protein